MKKTTVVIPNFNGINYLKSCLAALNQETSSVFDIIVVDNGSTDGSTWYLKQQYPQITVISNQSNLGFCKAVNQGIQAAATPYVLLLNNDTKVLHGFVRSLEEAIESGNRVFSVAAKMLMMDQPELLDGAGDLYCATGWAFARGKGKPATKKRYQRRCRIFSACGGAVLYKKEILEKIGLFDENHFAYLEDLDLGYRAAIFGYKNLYEPKAQVLHVGSGFSGSKYNPFKTGLASTNSVYVVLKNMPLLQIILNLPFLLVGFAIKAFFFYRKGMGKAYLWGLRKGLLLGLSKEGRKNRVRFRLKHCGNYVKIQLALWGNLIRRIYE